MSTLKTKNVSTLEIDTMSLKNTVDIECFEYYWLKQTQNVEKEHSDFVNVQCKCDLLMTKHHYFDVGEGSNIFTIGNP